jgi:hypothetical protein
MGPVGFAIIGLSAITFILGIVLIAVSGYLLDIVRRILMALFTICRCIFLYSPHVD